MSNTTKSVREIKAQCLWDAFEVLKVQSEDDGHNFVNVPNVVNLANQDERMQMCGTKIGDKSIYTKAKSSLYSPICKAIQKWETAYKVTSKKANSKYIKKLKKLDNKLASVEEIVVELQDRIHDFKKRLENKERQIELIEKDRDRYSNELYRLRKKYEYA